jgi:hypothetical protein
MSGPGIDLGPTGLMVDDKFVLAQGEWVAALDYDTAVQAVDASAVPFADVREAIVGLQALSKDWEATAYPSIVSLASAVVDYGTKAETYLPALDKELTALGASPADKQLLSTVEAIIGVLAAPPAAQATAVSAAIASATRFQQACGAGEQQLRAVVTAYATIYLGGAAGAQPALPHDLDTPLAALGQAWSGVGGELEQLKTFVDDQVKAGKPFTIDIGAATATSRWQQAAQAADAWRVNAWTR